MSNEKEEDGRKPEAVKTKKEDKPKKELTPQEIQKRKKMLVYPLFFLLFIGAMWLIFAPSGGKEKQQQLDGFNPELPMPKDEAIIEDKRTAYEQEAMRNKQEEKRRNLQDFAYMLEEENSKVDISPVSSDRSVSSNSMQTSHNAIQSSADAYRDVNRQLSNWYDEPATEVDEQSELELQWRVQELERKLSEAEEEKNAEEKQLELIEKSYQIAAKYTPGTKNQTVPDEEQPQSTGTPMSMNEKVKPTPVSQVYHHVVSLLAAPMDNDEFLEQYSKPRNMGFITASGNETVREKNAIRACVYQTVTLSDGKELQIRLLEPMKAGDILIPANTVLTGSAKMGGERLLITIHSIQYANNVIPVEMAVYDMDGMQGIFVPNSDELNAVKEIAANMGTQMGSSITITDDAGSQLLADLGRSAIQGTSQYVAKKMRAVKVTVKANYKVLLLPKV